MSRKPTLDDIFSSGLIKPAPKPKETASSTGRIAAEFEDINRFYDHHQRAPEAKGTSERRLAMTLQAIRASSDHRSALIADDRHGLLLDTPAEPRPEIRCVDDILTGPDAALLNSDRQSIFAVRTHLVPKARTDYTAERKPCTDFDRYRPLFEACHEELASGQRQHRPFQKDLRIEVGDFFVLNGVTAYVSEVKTPHKRGRHGRRDARLRCIFENGTESDMLVQSLRRQLIDDSLGRRITRLDSGALFGHNAKIKTGTVYVVRSLSTHPDIAGRKDLFKIGITRGLVRDRLAGAAQDPTYLMAPVHLLDEYDFFGADHRLAERLLHRFFGEAILKLEIVGNDGKTHRPREWFIAPTEAIGEAVTRLVDGSISDYHYDEVIRRVVPMS